MTVLFVSVIATGTVGSGDVAGAIQGTWDAAKTQIKAVVNNVVAFALQQQGVKHLGAAMTALFSLFEPVFSCVFGAIFLQQAKGIKSLFGIVLILLSLAGTVLLDNRK